MKPVNNEEKDWFQIIAIFLACLSSFTAGQLFSWSSPSIPKIVADKENYNITLDEASYFTVLPPIGTIVSAYIFASLSDYFGRKLTLLLVVVPQTLSWILTANATSVYMFYVARFISGFGDAIIFGVLPVYVAEVATPKVRGTWGNLLTFMIYCGQLSINIIGSYTSIPTAAYICLTVPIILGCTFVFMPETPYFFLMKGRVDDARRVLQKLRRKADVEEELIKLKSDVQRQMSESGTWKDLFLIQSNRKALCAGVFLRASQQLGGISSFAVYTQYIFLKSGGNVSASVSAIIFMGLCTILNLCASFTLDKIGRRRSYFGSLLLCGLVLLCEATYFFIEKFYSIEIDLTVVNWIPLAGMILYVFFYSFGLGIVPTLMLGELFSASIKGKALILLCIVFAALVSTLTKLFQLLDQSFGLFAPFLFFSLCCFMSTLLALYIVPETKGKTLEEIQQSLKSTKQIKKVNC